MHLPDKAAFADFRTWIRARFADLGRLEDLDAVVSAVARVEQAVVAEFGAMGGVRYGAVGIAKSRMDTLTSAVGFVVLS